MKRFLPVLVIFFLLIGATSVKSQDFNYDRAYQDYIYNYDLYKKAHAEYEVAKTQYQQGETLALQQKAQAATAKMLQARDQVMITYLTAVRQKMAETEDIDTTKRDSYYSLVDGEVDWYRSHRDAVSSAATLEDLQKDSEEGKNRYITTELIIYKCLTLIGTGKLDNFQNRTNDVVSKLDGKISEIRSNGDKSTVDIERWMLEVKNRMARSTDKETESWTIMDGIKQNQRDKVQSYNNAMGKLVEAVQYVKEANSFLKQTITEIKTQD